MRRANSIACITVAGFAVIQPRTVSGFSQALRTLCDARAGHLKARVVGWMQRTFSTPIVLVLKAIIPMISAQGLPSLSFELQLVSACFGCLLHAALLQAVGLWGAVCANRARGLTNQGTTAFRPLLCLVSFSDRHARF